MRWLKKRRVARESASTHSLQVSQQMALPVCEETWAVRLLDVDDCTGDAIDSQGFASLDGLVSSLERNDRHVWPWRHSIRVAEQAGTIARVLGLNDEQQEALRVASLLHDVGKVGVPVSILQKPGSLTLDEAEIMKQHVVMGSTMISQHLPDLPGAREAVASHHECWDGTGYPAGLRGTDLPLLGRILAVAEAYSAMTSDQPYRAALSEEEAVDELERASGTQFDPEIVRVFATCLRSKE